MSENTIQEPIANTELTEQEKVISLFQFIQELNKLKQKATINIKDYPWSFSISDIPNDPDNISVFYRDRVEDEDSNLSSVLLSVHKPEFHKCPEPDTLFAEWLEPGWDSYRNEVSIRDSIQLQDKSEEIIAEDLDESVELFQDDIERVSAFNKWIEVRSEWVETQKLTERTRNLFADLYRLYFELQRDSETMEMIVANGMLYDRNTPELKHPVLTHRVKLNYDADSNTVFIEDAEVSSELYSIAFQILDDINLSAVNKLSDDLQKNDYHPLDRNDTPAFLKVLVHQLSSESMFADNDMPTDWKRSNRLLLVDDPCYIVRKRLDGTLKAIEQIIENVQETGEVPAPIGDIVSGGTIDIPEDIGEETVEEQLAAVGGESVDILLSKEANKEQLEIAKRIEYYNAVLVQGPPGTGKTHTIANLMGHFLAQGKSVLVTSHTTKALNVLKEKVAPGLQNLCVSVLDDSNIDMERSIDGITSYMSKTTSHEIKREMDMISVERKQVIKNLAETRKKIFAIINQECNCIVYNGEEISPSKAAEFVLNNAESLSYIPGKVRINSALPLTFEQLSALYRSNEGLSEYDEQELSYGIPSTKEILSPTTFGEVWNAYQYAQKKLQSIEEENGWKIDNCTADRHINFDCPFGSFSLEYPDYNCVNVLQNYAASFGKIEKWMKCAAVDGKIGGAFRNKWETLINQIQKTCSFAESVVSEQFGKSIQFANSDTKASLKEPLEKLSAIFADKGKVSKLTLMMHKDYVSALEAVTINGMTLQSKEDCDIILHCIELENTRNQCARYWDELLAIHDVPHFYELDTHDQERVATNWIPLISKYLDWYGKEYQPLMDRMEACGFPNELIFSFSALDSDLSRTDKILSSIEKIIPPLCHTCEMILDIEEKSKQIQDLKAVLMSGKRCGSKCCSSIVKAVEEGNTSAYSEAYGQLANMYEKYILQNSRDEMLKTLEPVAPQWAEAIRSRRGIHGQFTVPDTIESAWKWKQLSGIIDDITAKPFKDLQADSLRLSKEYRKVTSKYAEKCAWYHLLSKTEADIDMKQALQGWKQTVKRIGKGTGKNAPMLKAKARELMTKCQDAVPGWIMPINRALESLNPKQNRFDIIIIDEASQSDISSLAILYMGRKLIIVGDDKQVSPMAVGVEIDKMNALEQMYIKDKIPNSHLYNAKTSIYDIAATTFQPLMLREHFRCVPEIIGFSNMLSYDYKIKPLRDASNSTLLPAVVDYRVAGGQRDGRNKTNRKEAEAIVALMKSCIEQSEYNGKTMGVISLLGDEQVKVIQQMIEEEIDPKEIVLRNILCGNSANFQGDERDIIFLSVVDSGDGTGPIHLQNFGADDAVRKRYNVAASRARDQLWVVHSLDSAIDLKAGDIRKTLIDYAANPHSDELKRAEVEENAESPFETAVASALVSRGYHLVQQWKVGAYRLDMVAVCDKKTVAIECDGERWHSGEAKLREDMERQTILERLGWRFIRIRGSEYYRYPEATIDRVIRELNNYGINPEETKTDTEDTRSSELLERVKNCAWNIIQSKEESDTAVDVDTIAVALSSSDETNNSVPSAAITKKLNVSYKKPNEVRHKQNEQLTMDFLEKQVTTPKDIISLLKDNHVQFVDKRQANGSLWIVGGSELEEIVKKARKLGVYFRFKQDGGNATKGKPGWWTK